MPTGHEAILETRCGRYFGHTRCKKKKEEERLGASSFQNILLMQSHTGLHVRTFGVLWRVPIQFSAEALKPNMEVTGNTQKA